MKLLIENNQIVNLYPDNYDSGNKEYNNSFIQITSYASDIDMKDVEQNQAWKFKITDGQLQYDVPAIKAKVDAGEKTDDEAAAHLTAAEKLAYKQKAKIALMNDKVKARYVKKWDDLEQVLGIKNMLAAAKQTSFDADLVTIKTFTTSKKQEINNCTTLEQVRLVDLTFSL